MLLASPQNPLLCGLVSGQLWVMTPLPETLCHRNFLIWWLGGAQSSLGRAPASIATSFLVLHQTGSAGAMGIKLL